MVFSEYPVNQIVTSLVSNTQESSLSLRERTARIDIRRDVEKLKFKYEGNGRLTDVSSAPSLLQSVHQLLEESQLNHIKKFVETEKHKNQCVRIHQQLEQLRAEVDQQFKSQIQGNPGALDLARSLFETELSVAGSRAALACLEDRNTELKLRVSQSAKEKEILLAKYQQIQDFRKLADSKQGVIRVLVKQNTNAASRLAEQQIAIQQYVQRSLSTHEVDVKTNVTHLKDHVIKEVDAFAALALPYLMYTVLESAQKLAVIDLSINRLTGPGAGHNQQLQQVLNALEFPVFKAPECLLRKAMEVKMEIDDMNAQLESHEVLGRLLRGAERDQALTVDHIAGLCQEVEENDRKQLDALLPVLQKRISRASQALAECLEVKDCVQAWWEQPAQYLVPWLKVHGRTYQQWRDQWTVTVTKLRQLQVQQQ
ncbi:AUGMIN subunit 5 [Lingula anatina]|uniref:AUGMIN subunit 5 n=1 Tax=Lingula anatina TaxID=7574 RepID=A0A1S3KII3_LINAN|nr:AUGMIN subunit 5 [Lingula anatina]|eukprot:XP_013422021.1 AUGMIN subunit 5 [Lingula anatina]